MKKLLIASTALVMVAGAAAAEVKVTGSGEVGLNYASNATTNDFIVDYDLAVQFNMSGKTDTGLGFGASFELNAKDDATADPKLWVSGTWGKLTFVTADRGDGASGIGIADVGYKGLGVDNVAEALFGKTAKNIGYRGTFGAVTVGVSYMAPVAFNSSPATQGEWSIGVGYKAGDYKVGIAYDSLESLSIGGGATFGAISVNAMYTDRNGASAWGVDGSYKLNSATTVTVAYADSDTAIEAAYGLGVAYSLGGGATLAGGIASVAGVTYANVGMTFDF